MNDTKHETEKAVAAGSKRPDAKPGRGPALSIASAVFGAASFPFGYLLPVLAGIAAAIAAIVLGVVALKNGSTRRGFARLGIALGILCIALGCAIIALYLHKASELGLS